MYLQLVYWCMRRHGNSCYDAVYTVCTVRESASSHVAVYAGLAVAVLVFIIVIIFIVCLLRRRVPLFIGQSLMGLT